MPRTKTSFRTWRIVSLVVVHALIAAHVAHWLVAGRTVETFEVSKALETLHVGVVTLGFLLLASAAIGSLFFGRFFCSWGCHFLALQDLAHALLSRFGFRPRTVRSRALVWVPWIAMLYLFVWPEIARLAEGREHPGLHFRAANDGTLFLTNDLFRDLPGFAGTLATFAIAGVLAILLLGSRAFCRYACPYGALFHAADRVAVGRIVLRGDCADCRACTDACMSGVIVHHEVQRFGKVIDGGCLKDLDCVDACPNGVLAYGRTTPPALRILRDARPRRSDFTIVEEVVAGSIFLAAFLAFRGLYDAVPFFLSLGIGAIFASLAVSTLRATHRAVLVASLLASIALVHSAFVRTHEFLGKRAFERIAVRSGTSRSAPSADTDEALYHFEIARRFGAIVPVELRRRLASLYFLRGDFARAESELTAIVARAPEDGNARMRLDLARRRLNEAEDPIVRGARPLSVPVP